MCSDAEADLIIPGQRDLDTFEYKQTYISERWKMKGDWIEG